MSKVAIITDTTSYIPKDIREAENIHAVALEVVFGNVSYKEELELSTGEFYKKIRESENLPTTSQPPFGDFLELFEKLSETHDEAVVITLSSAISGTYQTAASAANMVENIDVHVFDSEISCHAQAYYVIEAAEMAKANDSAETIMTHLEAMRDTGMSAYFMVDDLNHLHRGGRLTGAQLFVGSLLRMKPILAFRDKRIIPAEKIRTKKKAINRIKELFDGIAGTGKPTKAFVIHANRPDDAKALADEIQVKYSNVDVEITYFGAVIGTHVGEGTIGIGWYQP
ncbi:DegV family protein with EDD domain [Scopulibacillus darangshiensis]|uniref:DegV family protein with EDD domain n=1 Tax=Scopulibacillus darangshiensis TaxID=442528 RepID=A0A4R2NVP9_9BACL|nr:DegV family protein [Scopulibacillus darangshiensis]TCP26022.1 DegV family protein with EDD domain [Scopulibacillus darangshiensis]